MIRAVVFDLDGLIFNTEDVFELATERFLGPLGFQYHQEVRRQMMGQQADVSIKILKEYYGLSPSTEEIRSKIEREFRAVLPDVLALMPGFDTLISKIVTEGIPAAICTSSSTEYAKSLLAEFGYLDAFSFVLGGESVERGKPAPDCYLMACRMLGLPVTDVMVLEDSENGCRAAIDAGTFAVAVPSRHTVGHEYAGAAVVANTLQDPAIYEALGISK